METQGETKDSIIKNDVKDTNEQQRFSNIQKRYSSTERTNFLSRSKMNKQSFIQSRNSSYLQNTIRNKEQSEIVKLLRKENEDLKQQIIELKFSQFYQFDEKKLKGLIGEVQKLKQKLKYYRQELEKTLIEKDFIQRSYKKIKSYCEQLIKQKDKQKVQKLFVTESTFSPMIENKTHQKNDKQKQEKQDITNQAQKTCASNSFAKINSGNSFYTNQITFSKRQNKQKEKDKQVSQNLAKNFGDFSPIRSKKSYQVPFNDSLRKVKSGSGLNSQNKGQHYADSKDRNHIQTTYRFKR